MILDMIPTMMNQLRDAGLAGDGWITYAGVRYTTSSRRPNTIPVRTALHIMLYHGWSEVEYYTALRLYRARNPEGKLVDMSIDTVRWTALHIVCCSGKNTKSSLDTQQSV